SNFITKQVAVDNLGPTELAISDLDTVTLENVTDYTISGRSEANSDIHIVVSGDTNSIVADAAADTSGFFSVPLNLTNLNDGKLTITIMTEDEHGNKGKAKSQQIVKDTTPPEWITATF